MSLYNFKGTNRHRRLMQKTFFKNIDVSIPWGDAKIFGGRKPYFCRNSKTTKGRWSSLVPNDAEQLISYILSMHFHSLSATEKKL